MRDNNIKLEILLPKHVADELSYMVNLINEAGSISIEKDSNLTVEDLTKHILNHIADGSRRPGSWERQILEMLGIAVDDPRHSIYRQNYGDPQASQDDELIKVSELPIQLKEQKD